jgi:hypothetical protein
LCKLNWQASCLVLCGPTLLRSNRLTEIAAVLSISFVPNVLPFLRAVLSSRWLSFTVGHRPFRKLLFFQATLSTSCFSKVQ